MVQRLRGEIARQNDDYSVAGSMLLAFSIRAAQNLNSGILP